MKNGTNITEIFKALSEFFERGSIRLSTGDLRTLAASIAERLPEDSPVNPLDRLTQHYRPGPRAGEVDAERLKSDNVKQEPGGFSENEEALRQIIAQHKFEFHRLDGLLEEIELCRVCKRLDYKLRMAIKAKALAPAVENPPCTCPVDYKWGDGNPGTECLHREKAITVQCPEGAVTHAPRINGQNFIAEAVEWATVRLTGDNKPEGAVLELDPGESVRLDVQQWTHKELDLLPEFDGF